MAISFDIETVPQTELSTYQEEYFRKRLAREVSFTNEDIDNKDVQRRIKAVNPFLGKIICIGTYCDRKDEFKAFYPQDEKELLKEFWTFICDETQFISFNGLDFDIPYIMIRSLHHNISPPRLRNQRHSFLVQTRYSQRPHYDVAKWAANWDPRRSISLKLLCDTLKIDSPKEGEIVAEKVEEAYLDGKIELIAEYCLRDVKATYECYKKLTRFTQ